MLTEQWLVNKTRTVFVYHSDTDATAEIDEHKFSLDDILKFKTKNLHAIPFIQRMEYFFPLELWPERR